MQALRNIKYTLRKYFVPMLMSLIGLIMAFSAFMLISVQLDFEKGFDRFHPDAGNIYRVDLSDNNTIFRSILPPGSSDEVMKVNVSWWIFLLVFLFIQALTAVLVVMRYNSLALESPNISLETE